jgi:hypothetical protein
MNSLINESSTIEPKNYPWKCISKERIHLWKLNPLNQKTDHGNAFQKEEFTHGN